MGTGACRGRPRATPTLGWGSFPPPSELELIGEVRAGPCRARDESVTIFGPSCLSPAVLTRDRNGPRGLGGAGPLLRSPGPRSGRFYVMPNIKQQKKRVGIASRQRLQNLRYRSTVKTLTKRLRSAVDDGDEQRAATEYRELVQAIDQAAAHRALHRNTAARKKSQAARMLSGS